MSDTSTNTIRRSSSSRRETPEQRAKKKVIQLIIGSVMILLAVLLGIFIQSKSPNGAFIWAIGLGLGYVLQRSRFCFTASVRDPYLTGGTELTKAVIKALALSSVIYAALQIRATGWDLSAVDFSTVRLAGFIQDAGVHTLIGGFLFGIGAVIAGGCASGTLMRMGEGFVQQWITVIFFILGAMAGGYVLIWFRASGFLYTSMRVHLPQALGGWLPALLLQFGLLFVLYVAADWYGKKKAGEL